MLQKNIRRWSIHSRTITFWVKAKAVSSTVGGFVFGMARIRVIPPASAAAVAVDQSSLCVAPGSLTCTWTSIKPDKE